MCEGPLHTLIPSEPQMLENVEPFRMAGGWNRGATADAIRRHHTAEADANGEQQLNWT